jgi:hypothetical protein
MHQLTLEEKNKMSADNAERFMGVYPEYFGCPYNSTLLLAHLETQIGTEYPYKLENYVAAWEYLSELGVLQLRPAAPPSDAELAHQAEQAKQEQVRQNHRNHVESERRAGDAAQRAAEKNMPLHVLAGLVGQSNAQLRAQRSIAARTQDDRESNRLTPQELDFRAQARHTVMLAHPTLNRNSLQFSQLVATELAKLTGESNGQ